MNAPTQVPGVLPSTPVDRMTAPLRRFLHLESATGIVLLACTALALALANSPWADAVAAFWAQPLSIALGPVDLTYPLWYWINDGLMALFFFVIGLEIKREIVSGELSDRRAIMLPLVAAIGGAAIPALIFLSVVGFGPAASAWAVPTATDIAFVVGCLALLGPRVPSGLKIFLLSLAIFDDLLAVVIIAVFYSGSIGLGWLAAAVGGLVAMVIMRRAGIRSVALYTLAGIGVWFFTLQSGVHPTIAGVVLGLMTPARRWCTQRELRRSAVAVRRAIDRGVPAEQRAALATLRTVARENVPPSERIEAALHPYVAFLIMPLFALANAGVPVSGAMLGDSMAIAIALGLALGKVIGITGGAWIAVRTGLGSLPRRVSWSALAAGGCLAGIGFTMSMFIASLALTGTALTAAKTGVLVGSLVSGVVGMVWLRAALPLPPTPAEEDHIVDPPAAMPERASAGELVGAGR